MSCTYFQSDTAFEDELIYMPVGGNDCDDDDDAEDVYGKLVDFQVQSLMNRSIVDRLVNLDQSLTNQSTLINR